MRCSTLTRMSGNGSGGENGRILTHDFPKTVQTLPCMSHTASMGLGASGMWSSRDLCWQRGIGRVGQKKSTRLLMTSKIMAVWFDPSILLAVNAPDLNFTAKMHSRKKKRSLQTTNRDSRHFCFCFLNKWMFEKEISKKKKKKKKRNVLQ